MRTILTVFVLFFFVVVPVAAQTPTPDPTPTPSVIHGSDGDFVVVPEITYGEGGVIVAALLVAGLLLVQIVLEVSEWLKQ
jgi:signal peptidase I